MTPAALLFDFGGTLDADGIPWKDRFFALYSEEGTVVLPEAFDRAFSAADDALVGAVPRDLPFRDTVERLSHGVARGLGADFGVAGRVAERFVADARAKLDASAKLLANLAPRYRIGIVSNFYGNLAAVCSGTGIRPHVGVAIDSAELGFEKPDPRIFQAALEALETPADRAVFIGDSLPRDMEGARRLGMPHVWLKPGESAACCPADAVIARLDQLPGLLP